MAEDLPSLRRFGFLALLAFGLFSLLAGRLWFLQVMEGATFEQAATGNRTRLIYTEAPRGQIFDARGRHLAGRRESLAVVLDWTELRDHDSEARDEIFLTVAEELNDEGIKVKVDTLRHRFESARNGSLKPVIVADDVGAQVWVTIQEHDLPGFSVERRWIRTYPYGTIGSHIVGYTGTVGDQQRADELNAGNDTKRYFPGDELGLSGIEALFEQTLRGVPELRRVEIDADNRIIGTVEILQPAVPGSDIHLTLDIDYQYAAEQILADELRLARRREACKGCLPHVAEAGSLVALDVNDGSVVALASLPNFDPSDFTFGISAEQFSYLRNRPDQPFLDRATQGEYPAGSTFKPFTAYAAVTTGARDASALWEDEGSHTIENCNETEGAAGCVFRNAGDAVLGTVDLRRAIELSSDTYFYSLGEKFWVEQETFGQTAIQDSAARFGIGMPSGIQLPNENSGRLPTPENRKAEFGPDRRWFTGDNVNLSIGQGDLLVTPLQLTNSYAVLATGGVRHEPRLVSHVAVGGQGDDADEVLQEFRPRVASDEGLDPSALTPIIDGLLAVNRTGTASDAFSGFPLDSYPVAGKTGTSQVLDKADYALYAAFGPLPAPRYAVAAVLEEAGFGGDAAAPAVRRFFEVLAGRYPVPTAPLAGEPGTEMVRPELPSGGVSGEIGGTDGSDGDAGADASDDDSDAPPATTAPTTIAPSTSEVAPESTVEEPSDGSTSSTRPATSTSTPPTSTPLPSTTTEATTSTGNLIRGREG